VVEFEGQLFIGADELWAFDPSDASYELKANLLSAGASNPEQLLVHNLFARPTRSVDG
jgi:hypothetical protein